MSECGRIICEAEERIIKTVRGVFYFVFRRGDTSRVFDGIIIRGSSVCNLSPSCTPHIVVGEEDRE